MQITKNIIKSFNVESTPLDKVRLLKSNGVEDIRELSRISGIAYSQFVRLGYSEEKIEKSILSDIKGITLKSDEIHFYEMIGSLMSLGLIKKSIFIGEEDFVETLLNGSSIKYKKEEKEFIADKLSISIEKSLSTEVNLEVDTLLLKPGIGGYLAKNNLLIKGIEDLSINQLDILYKGIAERNPNYELLSIVIKTIKEKLQ